MLKKEDRFCQFDPVTKYLEKTGDQFDNGVVYWPWFPVQISTV